MRRVQCRGDGQGSRRAPRCRGADVRLPDGTGIELPGVICCPACPICAVWILTSHTSDEAMLDATGCASGYVVKDIKGMELARRQRWGASLLDTAAALMAKLRGAAESRPPSGPPTRSGRYWACLARPDQQADRQRML